MDDEIKEEEAKEDEKAESEHEVWLVRSRYFHFPR